MAIIKLELHRLQRALKFTTDGFKAALYEPAFRLEVAAAVILIPLALMIGGIPLRKIALIGSVLLVLIVELINTAIEKSLDCVSTEQHPLIKQAKDMGSAAVFLALINAALVWALLLL
jgi:diacylglycerol kinase (ATP)